MKYNLILIIDKESIDFRYYFLNKIIYFYTIYTNNNYNLYI